MADGKTEQDKMAEQMDAARAAAREGQPPDSTWPQNVLNTYLAEKKARDDQQSAG